MLTKDNVTELLPDFIDVTVEETVSDSGTEVIRIHAVDDNDTYIGEMERDEVEPDLREEMVLTMLSSLFDRYMNDA